MSAPHLAKTLSIDAAKVPQMRSEKGILNIACSVERLMSCSYDANSFFRFFFGIPGLGQNILFCYE